MFQHENHGKYVALTTIEKKLKRIRDLQTLKL